MTEVIRIFRSKDEDFRLYGVSLLGIFTISICFIIIENIVKITFGIAVLNHEVSVNINTY